MPEGDFDGKVAVVTGSGGGIGASIAATLASKGARVVVNDLDGDVANAAAGGANLEVGRY